MGGSVDADIFVGVPENMQLTVFPLSASDWDEIHLAYAMDPTEHFGVRICDIYAYANGAKVLSAVAAKIKPWMGKVFFPVSIHGQEKKFICHRRSFLKPYDECGYDRTTMLVLVIPANANVCISGRSVYDAEASGVPIEDLPDWQAEDLRADII